MYKYGAKGLHVGAALCGCPESAPLGGCGLTAVALSEVNGE